jgi:hypothetical protein
MQRRHEKDKRVLHRFAIGTVISATPGYEAWGGSE